MCEFEDHHRVVPIKDPYRSFKNQLACTYNQESHRGVKASNHHGVTNAPPQPDPTQPLTITRPGGLERNNSA